MSEKRLLQSKALSAYLVSRQTTLTTALARIGADQEFNGAEISDDIAGRIARLFGMTPERLAEFCAPYTTALPAP